MTKNYYILLEYDRVIPTVEPRKIPISSFVMGFGLKDGCCLVF